MRLDPVTAQLGTRIEHRRRVDVGARLEKGLGVNVSAGLELRRRVDEAPAAAVALFVCGVHGAADQLDQFEVQRRDEQVDGRLQPHGLKACNAGDRQRTRHPRPPTTAENPACRRAKIIVAGPGVPARPESGYAG